MRRKIQQDMPCLASQGLGRRNGCLGGWIVQLWTKEGQEGFLRRAAHVGRVCVLCVYCVCCVCVLDCCVVLQDYYEKSRTIILWLLFFLFVVGYVMREEEGNAGLILNHVSLFLGGRTRINLSFGMNEWTTFLVCQQQRNKRMHATLRRTR